MCHAQVPQRSDAGEARTRGPSVKHSTTEPLRSHIMKLVFALATFVILRKKGSLTIVPTKSDSDVYIVYNC